MAVTYFSYDDGRAVPISFKTTTWGKKNKTRYFLMSQLLLLLLRISAPRQLTVHRLAYTGTIIYFNNKYPLKRHAYITMYTSYTYTCFLTRSYTVPIAHHACDGNSRYNMKKFGSYIYRRSPRFSVFFGAA